jgi:hypothetical protein
MTQKELTGIFKIEAASQGVHLTQSASSSNVDSHGGRFFKLACCRYRLYYMPPPPQTRREPSLKPLYLFLYTNVE